MSLAFTKHLLSNAIVSASVLGVMAGCTSPTVEIPWSRWTEPFPKTKLEVTNQPNDIAIDNSSKSWPYGYDFLVLQDAGGGITYVLSTSLQLNVARQLAASSGEILYPPVTIPANAGALHIREDGTVLTIFPDSPEQKEVGRILVARVVSPYALERVGPGRLRAGMAAEPVLLQATTDGSSPIRQGVLDAIAR